jgi:carbohydrate esterase-like sialic acid-specific acetylesterase
MRFYTSLALGLLAAFAGGACSSDDEGDLPPPYTGGLSPQPSATNTPGSGGAGTDVNGSAGAPPVAGGGTGSAEPNPTVVAPSEPPPGAGGTGPDSTGAGGTGTGGTGTEEPPPAEGRTLVFLLFGQSNMWGVPNPTQEDLAINERVEVLVVQACNGRQVNQWIPAQPPLHGCAGQIGTGTNGPGLGPGDYFAKTVAEAFPEDTILLVPAAVPGVSITTFQPGQGNYTTLVARARLAQQRGTIAGMIFHQGETDNNSPNWPQQVKTMVDALRNDLGTGEVPFIVGELMPGGDFAAHNTNRISQLPGLISNTSIASSSGFTPLPNDGFGNLHFDLRSQREFGRRYGELMVDALTP